MRQFLKEFSIYKFFEVIRIFISLHLQAWKQIFPSAGKSQHYSRA